MRWFTSIALPPLVAAVAAAAKHVPPQGKGRGIAMNCIAPGYFETDRARS